MILKSLEADPRVVIVFECGPGKLVAGAALSANVFTLEKLESKMVEVRLPVQSGVRRSRLVTLQIQENVTKRNGVWLGAKVKILGVRNVSKEETTSQT